MPATPTQPLASRLAERLSERRAQRGMTQRAAAAEAGVSHPVINRAEAGVPPVQATTLARVLDWAGLGDLPISALVED